MATVHRNKKEALEFLREKLEQKDWRDEFIRVLSGRSYSESDIEFVLEAFASDTNHIVLRDEKDN